MGSATWVVAENTQCVFGGDIKTWCRGLGYDFTYLLAGHFATFAVVGDNDGFENLFEVFQQHFFCGLHT